MDYSSNSWKRLCFRRHQATKYSGEWPCFSYGDWYRFFSSARFHIRQSLPLYSWFRRLYTCWVTREGFFYYRSNGNPWPFSIGSTDSLFTVWLSSLFRWGVGSGDSPEQTELIRKGFWYGGQNSLIRPSQNTIPLNVVHPEIKRCFLQCFNDGHASPHLRPTAEEWCNALQVAVNELSVCDKVDTHHYSRNYDKCYWCERVAKLGVDIFPAVPGTAKAPSATGSSKLAAIDKPLESIFPSLSGTAATIVKSTAPSTNSQPVISISSTATTTTRAFNIFAANNIRDLVNQKGQLITVFGRVFTTYYDIVKESFFVYFGKLSKLDCSYSPFIITIPSEGLQNLYAVKGLNLNNLNNWKGNYVQITGLLAVSQDYAGRSVLQIVLKESKQIKLISKDEADKLLSRIS